MHCLLFTSQVLISLVFWALKLFYEAMPSDMLWFNDSLSKTDRLCVQCTKMKRIGRIKTLFDLLQTFYCIERKYYIRLNPSWYTILILNTHCYSCHDPFLCMCCLSFQPIDAILHHMTWVLCTQLAKSKSINEVSIKTNVAQCLFKNILCINATCIVHLSMCFCVQIRNNDTFFIKICLNGWERPQKANLCSCYIARDF